MTVLCLYQVLSWPHVDTGAMFIYPFKLHVLTTFLNILMKVTYSIPTFLVIRLGAIDLK